ncbi:hypothetical protein Y886_07940 [Xanthomonas hyacinthi DSM 19077]|nr:hypothetical protein Y886_07940 [Xanthomonas hyacinthi DSM 19077]
MAMTRDRGGKPPFLSKAFLAAAFVVACLSCAWFGFWFGFSEMFFIHVDGRYTSDAAELVSQKRILRCLEEDPKRAADRLREILTIQRQILALEPQPVGQLDRLQVIVDPRALWLMMQQRQAIAETRVRMTALALDDSRPASCGGRAAEERRDVHERDI